MLLSSVEKGMYVKGLRCVYPQPERTESEAVSRVRVSRDHRLVPITTPSQNRSPTSENTSLMNKN